MVSMPAHSTNFHNHSAQYRPRKWCFSTAMIPSRVSHVHEWMCLAHSCGQQLALAIGAVITIHYQLDAESSFQFGTVLIYASKMTMMPCTTGMLAVLRKLNALTDVPGKGEWTIIGSVSTEHIINFPHAIVARECRILEVWDFANTFRSKWK